MLIVASYLVAAFAKATIKIGMAPSQTNNPPRWHVLLVGLGPSGDGMPIPNGVSDIHRISDALQQDWHVPGKSIKVLDTKKLTEKASIEKWVRNWLIKPSNNANDCVFFAFAGHGTQIPAKRASGHIQAIIPSDVRKGKSPGDGFLPQSLITGPEISGWIAALNHKGVTNILLTFDCCNSGSNTKGGPKPRGVQNLADPISVPDNTIAGIVGSDDLIYTSISAAQADQWAWDDGKGGYFTYALVDALKRFRNLNPTYEDLLDSIRASMNLRHGPTPQTPVGEGCLDRIVFSDQIRRTKSFGLTASSNGLFMEGGAVQLVRPGMLVQLFRPTDLNQRYPVGLARVEKITAGQSALSVVPEMAQKIKPPYQDLRGGKAVISDDNEISRMTVAVSPANKMLRSSVEQLNRGSTRLRLVPPSAPHTVLIREVSVRSKTEVELIENNGHSVGTSPVIPNSNSYLDAVKSMLASYSRARSLIYLRPDPSPADTRLEVEFISIKDYSRVGNKVVVNSLNGGTSFRNLQRVDYNAPFAVRVRITPQLADLAWQHYYVALLDTTPRAKIEQLWPSPRSEDDGSIIPSDGAWYYLEQGHRCFRFDQVVPGRIAKWWLEGRDGVGITTFQLVVTEDRQRFESILQPGLGESIFRRNASQVEAASISPKGLENQKWLAFKLQVVSK